MVRLEVIEIEQPSEYALESLMAYASVSDEGQKDILKECLVRAFDMVQRASDTAILSGKWRISADDHPGIVRLYMGGKVETVTDCNGLPVMFNQRGRNVYVGTDEYVEVTFTTTATRLSMLVCFRWCFVMPLLSMMARKVVNLMRF
jgi:hypothetical protein